LEKVEPFPFHAECCLLALSVSIWQSHAGWRVDGMIGAVDIGGTKIAVGMLGRDGRILADTERPTSPEAGWQAALQGICTMLRQTALDTGGTLEGIGVGCTGPVDALTGSLGKIEFLPDWEGHNLIDELRKVFGVPVFLENDADTAALGEYAWGAGRGARRFIFVTVSTGIGVGLVFDGQIYRGVAGAHPEIGHHVIDRNGPHCECGANGCWESLASGPALARAVGMASALEVCQAARQGDAHAVQAVVNEGRYLGIGLANLINIFTPDVIALGGGVMRSLDLFWKNIHQTIRENCRLVPFEKTRLVPAVLGPNAGLVGAARVWMNGTQNRHKSA
jgi:glucokinase